MKQTKIRYFLLSMNKIKKNRKMLGQFELYCIWMVFFC